MSLVYTDVALILAFISIISLSIGVDLTGILGERMAGLTIKVLL